jgi:hypothetical protein
VQQISKRSCSASSEELEVEECLPEEPDSRGLDSEHPFYRHALVIIPRIDSGDEELQILIAAVTRVIYVISKPLHGRNKIVMLALYPPRQAERINLMTTRRAGTYFQENKRDYKSEIHCADFKTTWLFSRKLKTQTHHAIFVIPWLFSRELDFLVGAPKFSE